MPMFNTNLYSNDGSVLYGNDGNYDFGFTITINKNSVGTGFSYAENGATVDGGNLNLPFDILGLTLTKGKQTPDNGLYVGDTDSQYDGNKSGELNLYVVPVPNIKSVSNNNLARFKAKCDETYQKKGEGGGITNAQVIEKVEQLPTATADSPDFVQTLDGTLYRKKAVEGGRLLGTWVFNEHITVNESATFNINFTSNQGSYTYIDLVSSPKGQSLYYETTLAYDGAILAWTNLFYKTIQITDISALTNEAEFTQWLTANATKQGGGASVSYEYVLTKGSSIVDIGTYTVTVEQFPDYSNIITLTEETLAKLMKADFISVTFLLSDGELSVNYEYVFPITTKATMSGINMISVEALASISGSADDTWDHTYSYFRFKPDADSLTNYKIRLYTATENPYTEIPRADSSAILGNPLIVDYSSENSAHTKWNYYKNVIIGQTVDFSTQPDANTAYINCTISGSVGNETDITLTFINCTGTFLNNSNTMKICVYSSPNLVVNGRGEENWKNIWIDGVASYGQAIRFANGVQILKNSEFNNSNAPSEKLVSFQVAFASDDYIISVAPNIADTDYKFYKVMPAVEHISASQFKLKFISFDGSEQVSPAVDYVAIGRWK